MIPRIIHYCWFGGNELPELERRCIASWSEKMPGCETVRWDESNFDFSSCAFAREAHAEGKWAFVSDYARFRILRDHGGVFLDTDVELLRPLDDLLALQAFTGFTKDSSFVNPGLVVASEAGNHVMADVVRKYESMNLLPQQGRVHPQSSPRTLTALLEEFYGLRRDGSLQDLDGLTVFPAEFFDPIDPHSGLMNVTDETYSIHHYSGTWLFPAKKYRLELRKKLAPKVGPKLSWFISSVSSVVRYGKDAF